MGLLIQGIRTVDPGNRLDQVGDILIEDGRFVVIGKNLQGSFENIIKGDGLCLIPGFIDTHVHFREPGYEHKETIETGIRAALHGGYVGCVTMPNTNPPCDTQSVVAHILRRAKELNFNLFPCGTISKHREGKEISEMAELKRAGCVAVSDDGSYVANSLLMRHAMEYASMWDLLVISHAIDPDLSQVGVINEGRMSTLLGLKGSPNAAEAIASWRDIALSKLTKARLHLAHVSTHEVVKLVREAKREGLHVTCEVTPHHLALTDEAVGNYDTNFKMNPPLRTAEDIEEIVCGLKDGTIDCIGTDHAPHAPEEKELEFADAPFGATGLETAFGVVLNELYHKRKMSLQDVIMKMSIRPCELIGVKRFNEIREGFLANVAIVSLDQEWEVRKEDFHSKSVNSCFVGKKLKGKVLHTICNGKIYSFV